MAVLDDALGRARIARYYNHPPRRLNPIAKGILTVTVLYEKWLDRDVYIFIVVSWHDLVVVDLVSRCVGALEAGGADSDVLIIGREDVVHHGSRATWTPEFERLSASHDPGREDQVG